MRHKPRTARKLLALVPLVFLACCSCGRQGTRVYPVSGKVFFMGKPTPRAVVYLHPIDQSKVTSLPPRGIVQDDGSFRITTFNNNDGAPPGRYAVTVIWLAPSRKRGDDDGNSLLPLRYANPALSQLSVEVKATTNELEPLQLKK